MNAKEYLEQIQLLDVKIQQDLERLEEMKHSASGMRAIRYDTDKVQVSPADRMSADIARYIDFNERINREIDKFTNAKEKIINQIQGMTNPDHIKVLFKIYVQYKSISDIADEMGIACRTVVKKHSKALRQFEDVHKGLTYIT